MALKQRIAVDIDPESDEFCGDCHLLKGINVAECRAHFVPVFQGRKTLRPQECRDAATTMELTQQYLGTWNQLP